ncbi:HAD-IA family hydrolase [Vibrio hannami]|uniref:HAD family hydrolase n=1 Tax=Vibrio hannami TaxID=2717094 RepID=UPI002410A2E4|nr:HAD-IA family hydrolase [Vibrio hannami]MDG3088625.1 HAD-IA family hydrolase [Vibrio hannami]
MLYRKKLFIFDMDGVLLDSEPHWRAAQIDLLSRFEVTITEQDCIRYTMGKRIDDISSFWINRFDLDVSHKSFSDLLLNETASLISSVAEAREGLYQLIEFLNHNNMRVALATSSSPPIITAVLDKLNLSNTFELALSADSVENGKPFPDVYLEVCRRLGVQPEDTMALEDSLTGVTAAVNAKITTIAIPEKLTPEFAIADYHVTNLNEVPEIVSQYIDVTKAV